MFIIKNIITPIAAVRKYIVYKCTFLVKGE